jgi:hypothetical protein
MPPALLQDLGLADNNRLTRMEALKLFTSRPAWFMNGEDELGKIAPR